MHTPYMLESYNDTHMLIYNLLVLASSVIPVVLSLEQTPPLSIGALVRKCLQRRIEIRTSMW